MCCGDRSVANPVTRCEPVFMHKYDVVVFRLDHYSWGWGVRRNGKSLPIPLRAIGCRSEAGTKRAATAALRKFLMGLKKELEA